MPKPLRDLLPGILQQASAQRHSADRLRACWNAVAGKALAAHTKAVALRKGILYIQTDDAGVHFHLSLEKPRLIKKLSEQLGHPVTDVVVRAGDL